MVRRAQLQVDGYVFVLPEQVEGVAEYPFYAKVTALTSDIATIRSIGSDEPVTCNLDVAIARLLTVSKVEATRTQRHLLLRQAAWTESANRFWHGQVVGVDGRLAQLQPEDRVVLVEPSCLTPVAPVVALLLLRVPLHASMTRDGLMDMQTSILGRNLDGTASAPASNAIPSILDGFAAPPDMPDGHSDRQWIDPRTGRQCRFRLQHVVDYAFVVDGNQSAPPSLRLSIGHSFCQEPRQLEREPAPDVGRARELVSSSNMTPTEQADSIISLFAQEEPASPVQADHFPERDVRRDRRPVITTSSSPVRSAAEHNAVPVAPAGGSTLTQSSTSTTSVDARIIEQLMYQPELLARFAQVISAARNPRTGPTTSEPESVRRQSKYSFAPSAVQTAVHEGITAPEHLGKAPSVFVETVVYAAAVRFQPHPGIIIRLYDFQFGMFGLSIMHFVPFGVHQRM